MLLPAENEQDNFEITNGTLVRYHGRAVRPMIPARVTAIGRFAFAWNSYIQSIVIPGSVRTIAQSAFSDCPNLRSVQLPAGLEKLEEYAFYGTGLTAVEIPPNIRVLGERTFGACRGLRDVTIPDQLTSVHKDAFSWCNGIERVHASQQWKSRNSKILEQIMPKKQ